MGGVEMQPCFELYICAGDGYLSPTAGTVESLQSIERALLLPLCAYRSEVLPFKFPIIDHV